MDKAKQKAEELYLKFYNEIVHTNVRVRREVSRGCALIAVDEILDSVSQPEWCTEFMEYWKQVKNHLNKM